MSAKNNKMCHPKILLSQLQPSNRATDASVDMVTKDWVDKLLELGIE